MVNFEMIKRGLGFGFKGFGFFWGVFDRFLCNWLCFGTCSDTNNNTCTLLFLLVAIIFVVCGYAIISLPKSKKQKVKKIIDTDIK